MPNDNPSQKLFVSYSWSTPEHEDWVLALAHQLSEAGVQVILDKWDLKEGHDANAFMERMVNDPSVTKVIMVSDKVYADKANGRAGGVGTETQIISKEVYESQNQEKFVAVLPERDEGGKPYLPTYYGSRVYIDLSDPSHYAENLEKLLRWIYDKPLHVRPEIGRRPAFLDDGSRVRLGTETSFLRALDAIKGAKSFAPGATDEFLLQFADHLQRFRLEPPAEVVTFDDIIVQSIDEFIPYRNQIIDLTRAVAQYAPTQEYGDKIHRFFERLIPYMSQPKEAGQWNEFQSDNLKFIVHEMFLYVLAVLLDNDRFDIVNQLLITPYYVPGRSEYGKDATVTFGEFCKYTRSLEYRNQRIKLNRLSVRADMLSKRSEGSGVEFRSLMQAEFVVFLRSWLTGDDYTSWWPETLLYSTNAYGPFEKFARSASQAYFNRFKTALGVPSVAKLVELLAFLEAHPDRIPKWQFERIKPRVLANADQLGSKP